MTFASCLVTGLALAALLSAQGCARSAAVSIPELDGSVVPYSRLHFGKITEADVRHEFGDPPVDEQTKDGGKIWIYPVRAFHGTPLSRLGLVLAAILRVEFDRAEIVSDWYFLDPRTHRRLGVTETLSDALGAVTAICGARGSASRQIVLEPVLQRGRTTMAEVKHLGLAAMPPASFASPRTVPGSRGQAWDIYVDRPSPVFVPPFYYIIGFNAAGVATSGGATGYGGCI